MVSSRKRCNYVLNQALPPSPLSLVLHPQLQPPPPPPPPAQEHCASANWLTKADDKASAAPSFRTDCFEILPSDLPPPHEASFRVTRRFKETFCDLASKSNSRWSSGGTRTTNFPL